MDKKSGFSFGFKARSETGPLKTKSVLNEVKDKQEETDFIKEVDGSEIKSVKEAPKKAGPLVIPLIQKNKWRTDVKAKPATLPKDGEPKVEDSTEGNLSKAAAKELIEAARRRENEEDKEDETKSTLEIPLLMQNQVPEGFETDEKIRTDLRPEVSSLEDYDQVPIEQFGLALLRGMGWSDGDGIGKNKKSVKPIEAQLRPKGMGLGADRSALLQDKSKNARKRPSRPGDVKAEETLEIKKGVHCVLTKKPYEDLYATIQGVDDDNNRCMVKLSLSGEMVSVSHFSLRLVEKTEFDKFSRYLNKGKSDRYKEQEKNGRDSPAEKKRRKNDNENRDSESDYKQSNKPTSSSNSNSHSSKKHSEVKINKHWVRPHLKVKIIDRSYKEGRYYSSKVIVDDVLPGSIVCRTDSGRLLEGLSENQLETVIPKQDNSYIMIVCGKHGTEIGQVIQRDKRKEKVTVQLLTDRDSIVTLHYDDVCEYTGNVDHLLDF